MPLYAVYDGDLPVGFVAVRIHSQYAAEVDVIGSFAALS